MSHPRLEVCVDSAQSLNAAIKGKADRIELCSALALGGLTPSAGLMALAANSPIPVRAMIRPRAGNFCYTGDEVTQMVSDIDMARRTGLAGVVLGACTQDRQLDTQLLRQLRHHAAPLRATLHRVVDILPDPTAAITLAIDLGFDAVLTSGGAKTALHGMTVIAEMMCLAAGRIDIMPGCGIRAANAVEILTATGANWIHASCGKNHPTEGYLSALNFAPETTATTDAETCRKISDICRSFKPPA